MHPSISFRLMTYDNFPGAIALKNQAGWNQVEADWELFLKSSPAGCFVAEYENTVIGTATSVNYSERFSWISMVLVDPRFRGQGIARRLMELAIESVKTRGVVRLDASEMGRPLYEKMGFEVECQVVRMLRQPGPLAAHFSEGIMPVSEEIFATICEKDQPIFGAERRFVLDNFRHREEGNSFYKNSGEILSGYCFSRQGTKAFHIGPLVADDEETARQLLFALLEHHTGETIILDTFVHNPDWLAVLADSGFAAVRNITRMSLGQGVSFGIPAKQFALAGLEFG
ncbi:MAG: GNAT family N-acetyltransferase [Bacteroidia bacterium]|nr:GNAT family N-acetyltransferase [Bacteroidia bacterium]